ncbi:MAG: MerR family transcriptional regulator [Deltaproteobacteria bacterium]|nr:MerR family transcriptional regulator [Deltaproteobacteria bacterium]
MRLGELARAADVSRDTVQYYLREGLLPKPRLRRKKLADYDATYIDRIRFIRELQENHGLSISVIKQILRRQKRASSLERSLFRLHSKYFTPRDHLLTEEVVGEEAFLKATGLGPKWLARGEEWGIITYEIREGAKVYSHEAVTLGKLIVEMDAIGLGPKDGFDREALKVSINILRQLVEQVNGHFARIYWGKLSSEAFHNKGVEALEVAALYFYHLFRKLCKEHTAAQIRRLAESQDAAGSEPETR